MGFRDKKILQNAKTEATNHCLNELEMRAELLDLKGKSQEAKHSELYYYFFSPVTIVGWKMLLRAHVIIYEKALSWKIKYENGEMALSLGS